MTVAVAFQLQYDFFMNWCGNQKAEGFEDHLIAMALAMVIAFQGGGPWSADRWIVRQLQRAN